MSTTFDHLNGLQPAELRERRNALMLEGRELSGSGELVGDDLKRFESIEAEITEVQQRIETLEIAERKIGSGVGAERGDDPGPEWRQTRPPEPGQQTRDSALRTIERHADVLSAQAGDRLEKLVRRDRFGLEARYLDAVGSPDYEIAFGKMLAHPQDAHYTGSAGKRRPRCKRCQTRSPSGA
jgi:hypothetical protein